MYREALPGTQRGVWMVFITQLQKFMVIFVGFCVTGTFLDFKHLFSPSEEFSKHSYWANQPQDQWLKQSYSYISQKVD